MSRSITLFVCLVAAGLLMAAAVRGAESQLEGLKATYAQVQTVQAKFHQKIFLAAMKRERAFDGEFFYKRSKGFLWKYTSPIPKIFLFDGSAIWEAEEDKPYVTKEKTDKGRIEGTFLDLVNDVAKLDELFTVKAVEKSGDGQSIELLPKKEGTVQAVRIVTDKANLIKKIDITEITGNTNSLEFSSVRVNRNIPDSTFVFKPGKKEVIER